jgi:SAM-dependent methyltransferase
MDFPDATFDGCLVASTFMHLENPCMAVNEIVRVLKPGGRLASIEPDWDTIVLATGNAAADTTIVRIIRKSVRHSGIAHRLPGYFRAAGLIDISVQAGTWVVTDYADANETWRVEASVKQAQRLGTLSSKEGTRLLKLLRRANIRGMFFGSSTGFAVVGTKP